MKKIINTAPPVVVATIRTPLEGSLSISSGGAALSQVYDAVKNTYEPVDRRDTPLVLTPVVSLIDPDTKKNVPLSSLSSVEYKWLVGNSTTPVTSRTPSDDYYLQTDDGTPTGTPTGALVVRHNVSHADGQAVTILCQFSCVDSGRSETYKYDAAVLLTSEDKVQDQLFIHLENPSKVTFNPITAPETAQGSYRTFKARMYNGGSREDNSKFKFFWYVDGVLANTKACYVSGQNTDTLVLDAQYADNVLVTARFAMNTTAASPDHPAKAECTLIWEWPRMKVLPYSMSSESIKLASESKTFGAVIQAYSKDISDAKRNKYCKLKWYIQPTNSTSKTFIDAPWGFTKTIAGSLLFNTTGAKVNVGAVLYTVGAKSTVGGAGVETEVASTENPVVITTIRTPLTGSLFISSGGGALTQVYDAIENTYEPTDRRDTPLVLTPVSSLTDPDTGQIVPLSSLSSVEFRWYIGNSTTPVTSRTPSDEYYLQTTDGTNSGTLTGALVVRHNVGAADKWAVPILCEMSCTDNSRSETYKFDASVFLTTEEKVQDVLSIQMGNPSKVTYDPIAEDSSIKVFKAKVYNGGNQVNSNNLTFFWYVGIELITDETLGYVSGQGTDTLTLDAEYYDNVLIVVRVGTGQGRTAPNLPIKTECTLIWSWPRMQALPYSLSGQTVKLASDDKRVGAIIQAYGKDIPSAKRARYCRLNFYTEPTDTMVRKDQGWGDEVDIKGTDLFQTGSTHVNVGVDLYTVGQLKAVVGYDSYQMVNGKLVGIGEPYVVIDDTTGNVVVCGD